MNRWMTGRVSLFCSIMEQIEQLFEQFMREQGILDRASSTLRGYEHSFQWFRKLMPEVTFQNITEEKVIDYYEKLTNRERRVGKSKIIKGVKNSTIRTYRNKRGSFAIGRRERI